MRRSGLAAGLLLAGLLAVAGCIRSKVLVVVKPDGSGYVVLTQLSTGRGGPDVAMSGRGNRDMKKQLADLAERFGEGVTLAKSETVKDKGFAAVFAFTNVNTVSVPVMAFGPMGETSAGDDAGAPAFLRQGIRFELSRTTDSCLVVTMPGSLVAASTTSVDTNSAGVGETADMSSMEEFRGLNIDVSLQILGSVLKHNASHPDTAKPDRFVLFHMEGDKLMEKPAALRMLGGESSDMNDMDAMYAKLLGLADATVETNSQVTIHFK